MRARIRLAGAVLPGTVALVLTMASIAGATDYSVDASCTSGGHTAPCTSGWYTADVFISWSWTPTLGGNPTSGCLPHSYTVDTSTVASCTVEWSSGPTFPKSQPINVEISSPTVSGAPIRGPDSNGWYNHPLSIAFTGSSFSGMASCASFSYTGPNTTSTTVTGSCTDNAGKTVSATTSPFAYDVSPPSLVVGTSTGDQTVQLNWSSTAFAPTAGVELIRQPGLSGPGASVLYRGPNTSFQDNQVRNRVRYHYTLIAFDAAGNTTVRSVTARPGPHLLWPPAAARTTAAPLLLWTPVRRATYYNVQLYRGRTQVLSRWPSASQLQLKSRWKFDRRRYHLRPGTYRWFVWPGFRQRSAGRYGRLIGSATFKILR